MIENIRKDGTVNYDMSGVQVPITPITEVAYQILGEVAGTNITEISTDQEVAVYGGICLAVRKGWLWKG